ncbi:MAG: hypothetical protein WCR17_00835 [Candidatus Methanomethylophilaceae archaeon]
MKMNRMAMIGFPLRLTIAFLILSISIPVLSGMVTSLEDDNTSMAAESEAEKVSEAISKVYYSGVGGCVTVEVDIDRECYIKLGGEGADAYTIGIYHGDKETGRIYLQRPSVCIFGDGLEVSGNCTILIECQDQNGKYGVGVSLV